MTARMGFPKGAGRCWAAPASLVAHGLQGVRIAPRSLARSNSASANALKIPGRVH